MQTYWPYSEWRDETFPTNRVQEVGSYGNGRKILNHFVLKKIYCIECDKVYFKTSVLLRNKNGENLQNNLTLNSNIELSISNNPEI